MVASAPPKKASHEDWHPADVKAALAKAGWTMTALAASHGINRATISNVFLRSYPLNEKRIADAIGVPAWEIWPSRWNKDGTPKPRGAHALQCSAREKARNSRPAAAAGKDALTV